MSVKYLITQILGTKKLSICFKIKFNFFMVENHQNQLKSKINISNIEKEKTRFWPLFAIAGGDYRQQRFKFFSLLLATIALFLFFSVNDPVKLVQPHHHYKILEYESWVVDRHDNGDEFLFNPPLPSKPDKGVNLSPIPAPNGVGFSRPTPDMLIKSYKKYNFS